MQLRKLGEFGLIEAIKRLARQTHPSIIQGIGDDAAVLRLNKQQCLLFTTDTLVEGLHFVQSYTSPYYLGGKSLSASLSDIAAMGGIPLYYVVSLSIPPNTPFAFIKQLYQGMQKQARRFGVSLVGGDTTAAQKRISITIALVGKAHKEKIVYRHGAGEGDDIYVTGFLGDAALGLRMLKGKKSLACNHPLIKKHLAPTPRVKEGIKIARLRYASSMIDISDGLLADLRHILTQSRAGAEIWLSSLPLSSHYKNGCRDLSAYKYNLALSGGEDYELLFTVPPGKKQRVARWAKRSGIPLTLIGRITATKGALKILDEHMREVAIPKQGFTHF